MTDVTDTAQMNTDADDQATTVIAVSAAVGAGLVVAGLAGVAAFTYYWLVKKKQGLLHRHKPQCVLSMRHVEYVE